MSHALICDKCGAVGKADTGWAVLEGRYLNGLAKAVFPFVWQAGDHYNGAHVCPDCMVGMREMFGIAQKDE